MRLIKNSIILFSLCFLGVVPQTFCKVLIIVAAYDSPYFIELQEKTFKKFLKDDYELIIFNDAKKEDASKKIEDLCNFLNIKCIRVPQEIHSLPYLSRGLRYNYQHPSVRNCNVVQYALNSIGFRHNDIVMLCDSDLFLIKEFSVREYLKKFALSGTFKKAKSCEYLWIGLILLDMQTLPNKESFSINCGKINNMSVDSGGFSYYYLKLHSNVKLKLFDTISMNNYYCKNCRKLKKNKCTHNADLLRKHKFEEHVIQFIQNVPIDWGSGLKPGVITGRKNIEFLLDKHFLHFVGGTGYSKFSPYFGSYQEFYDEKLKVLQQFIDNLLHG